ncbi:hypothetical protein Q8F55_002483 [Vanrija albida]|uniref:Uncharacterized protein n=1 Tax=Vanrija albida TaxID=181172 RepID=A0ABR3QA32_9TREE
MPRQQTDSKPKATSTGYPPWKDAHTLRVVRHVVASSLAARSALYADTELADVNQKGGNRINTKLQQALNTFTKQFPGADGIVKEEVARLQAAKGGNKSGGGAPAPPADSKKRKAAAPDAGRRSPSKKIKVERREDSASSSAESCEGCEGCWGWPREGEDSGGDSEGDSEEDSE